MYDLRMEEERFWNMHPLLFSKLTERHYRDKAETRAFLANIMGHRKEDGGGYSVEDFMPRPTDEAEPEGPAERLARKMKMAAMAAGA